MKSSLICIGRRIFDPEKGQISWAFIAEKDLNKADAKSFYFSKLKWLALGRLYEAKETKNHWTMSRVPRDLGALEIPDKIRESWEAEDLAAQLFQERSRAIRSSQNRAKKVAREFYRELRSVLKGSTFMGRKYFVEAVLEEFEKMERGAK